MGVLEMANFDFTQFISFDSILPYDAVQNKIENIFKKKGFSIIKFEEIENVKKDYYSNYWRGYTFELKRDDFLSEFMDWKLVENIPQMVNEFIGMIDVLLMLDISGLRVIICSFAEKEKTSDEFVYIDRKNIYKELFKMSPFSFICPDNLIISILDSNGIE